VAVVEDNAHGLFGSYRGRRLGTLGSLATLSFHETKNITCGEGGALLINDASFIERAEIVREKGTNRSRFFRGQVDKYTWVDLGSSYLPAEILAAFLFGQLEARERIQARRRRIWDWYADRLRDCVGDRERGVLARDRGRGRPRGCDRDGYHQYDRCHDHDHGVRDARVRQPDDVWAHRQLGDGGDP
jgi:dTDP-4-amino-4,6-dideoxygalactose transaminase